MKEFQKLKSEKAKKGHSVSVLGKDITFEMVQALSNRALLGKSEFIKLSRSEILNWIRIKCKSIINHIRRVIILMNGWICFLLLSKVDRKNIEDCFCDIEDVSLVFTR